MNRRHTATLCLAAGLLVLSSASAEAQSDTKPRDGYCDYVKGVAKAETALLLAPELFSSFGYLDQLAFDSTTGSGNDDLRLTMGVRYSFGDYYQARLIDKRANAECKRRKALSAVNGGTTGHALKARATVLDEAMVEAEEILAKADRDFERRRTTRQELIATRLRVEGLRSLQADTRRQLDELPTQNDDASIAKALRNYYAADNQVERQQAKLRTARAWDVSVRMGYDKFLGNDDSSPFFAVVQARFNVGWFLQHRGNSRAAEGRRRIARDDSGMTGIDVTGARLRTLLAIDKKRAQEAGMLVSDLETQLRELRKIGGEPSRRLAPTVWFELVKARADHEYLVAHVESLRKILGRGPK